MSRRDMIETLEICLSRIEAGSTIDAVVADYPDQARELRELLEIALSAQPPTPLRVPAAAQVNSRKRLLAKAEQLKKSPRPFFVWSGLRIFREHFGSAAFVVAMAALLFVALGSVNALPGDGLYPVKLAAEQAGISLAASDATRLEREAGFDTLRAEEVARMIEQGRSGPVAFGGFLTYVDAKGWQAAGIPLQLSPALQQQAQGLPGAFVEIQGNLGLQGAVTVEKFSPLLYTLRGTLQNMSANSWTVSDTTVQVTPNTQISDAPKMGDELVIQAARLAGQNRMLAVSVELAHVNASPTIAPTFTAQPSQTPPPSATPSPSITPAPTQAVPVVPAPRESETASSEHEDDTHATPEPEHKDDHEESSTKSPDEPTEDSHQGGD